MTVCDPLTDAELAELEARISEVRLELDGDGLSDETLIFLHSDAPRLVAELRRARGTIGLLLGPEDERCERCGGVGRRMYPSTATWMGGIAGQTMTEGVCDRCWGTGSRFEAGVDLRKLWSETQRARSERDAARAKLDDWQESYAKVVEDRCPTDEVHCACVPILRAEADGQRERADRAERERDEARAERDEALENLRAVNARMEIVDQEAIRWGSRIRALLRGEADEGGRRDGEA